MLAFSHLPKLALEQNIDVMESLVSETSNSSASEIADSSYI